MTDFETCDQCLCRPCECIDLLALLLRLRDLCDGFDACGVSVPAHLGEEWDELRGWMGKL
jgi:hypothetical protein